MKKTFIILILVFTCFFVGSGFAQIQIGPLVGGNLSGLSIEPDIQGSINTKTGFAAGGIIVINFSPMFGLQFEPTYMQKGAVIYSPITDVALILEIEQTIEVNYIDIPVLFKVSFGEEFIKPYILAGGYIAFPLENGKTTLDKIIGNGQDIIGFIPSEGIETFEPEIKTKSIDYGLNFGAGIAFPLGIIDLFLEAQYSLGLTELNDEDFRIFPTNIPIFPDVIISKIKNKGFQIKAGLLFTL
ncbi:MAG: porin family protein [Candidatus Kariarchaeaceae archaeon]|jgi:hypothetical protein